MSIKSLVVSVIETIIKVIVLVFAIIYIGRGAEKAYEFGYAVFADKPMTEGTGKTITVGIPEGADVKEVAAMLESKGLIEDPKLFIVQEYLSAYHDKIKPGMYDLSTSMTAVEMLEIISSETVIDDIYSEPVEVTPIEEEIEALDGLEDQEEEIENEDAG